MSAIVLVVEQASINVANTIFKFSILVQNPLNVVLIMYYNARRVQVILYVEHTKVTMAITSSCPL
jgi:hypothetical protein